MGDVLKQTRYRQKITPTPGCVWQGCRCCRGFSKRARYCYKKSWKGKAGRINLDPFWAGIKFWDAKMYGNFPVIFSVKKVPYNDPWSLWGGSPKSSTKKIHFNWPDRQSYDKNSLQRSGLVTGQTVARQKKNEQMPTKAAGGSMEGFLEGWLWILGFVDCSLLPMKFITI